MDFDFRKNFSSLLSLWYDGRNACVCAWAKYKFDLCCGVVYNFSVVGRAPLCLLMKLASDCITGLTDSMCESVGREYVHLCTCGSLSVLTERASALNYCIVGRGYI